MFKHKTKNKKRLKVALVASSGGHLSQLLLLAESWKGYETFCITTVEVVGDKLRKYGNVYIVGECNREHPLRVILVLLRCINIILRERPDVVISTGAAAGCIVCFLGKFIGAKVAWLDSIANTEKLSLSGRLIRPFADLVLSQWPEVARKYNNVAYVGCVI